jgi:amino acid adenylation domain-containing protein/thioester reductase-like protein
VTARGAISAIERSCRRHADLVAVESHDAPPLTFGELHTRARGLARELRAAGVGPNDLVALDLEKCREYLIGVLGVWYAGAGFLSLGSVLPEQRRQLMLSEAKPRVILDRERISAVSPANHVVARSSPDDLAYVIYTSGSSGRPKGVRVPERGLLALFETQSDVFRLGPGKRALFQLSTLFDASVSDMGTALVSGATLVIEDPAATRSIEGLVSALERRRITHADLPPSLLPLLDPAQLPACLETLVIGGEAAEPARVRAFARRVRVVNVYGPTEATVCSSLCVCDPENWDRALLGAPLPGVRYRVDDGELLIGGDCLALGYVARPELDAVHFVTKDGERWYRTGDRVRELPRGELEFLGRTDRQIKLHGVRIEPGEIEHALLRHPSVREAAVLLRARKLVGFVSLGSAATERELREHLARQLPAALVPSRIEIVERLPRTSSDKVDLGALSGTSELASIVQGLLGLSELDEKKSFSELGGDSFSALELTLLVEALGLPVSVERILSPTPLRELTTNSELPVSAGAVWLREAARLDEPLEPARGEPRFGPLFLTGATGSLGSRLLEDLAKDREVVCLVRARDAEHGRERVHRALLAQGLALADDRFRVMTGDLRERRFGLAERDWEDLAASVAGVVHAGAAVNVALPYAALERANVGGTKEAVRLVSEGAPKVLHHVSTLSVFVGTDRAKGRHFESDDLSLTREVYGGYAQSKWAAELVARQVERRVIYRLGLTLGGSPEDLFSRFVRGTSRMGAVPAAALDFAFDVTPLELAAATIAEIARGPAEGETFHVCGQTRSLAELAKLVGVEAVETDEWLARARSLATDRDVATAYLALCRVLPGTDAFARHRGADLFEATLASFDDSGLRKRSRIARPSIDLERYVRAALARGNPR